MTSEPAPGVAGTDAARLEAVIAAFGPVRVVFETLVDQLAADEADLLTVAQLQDRIASAGREVTRHLLQGHMDLRSIREPRRIEGACRHLVKDRLDITGPAGDWKAPKPSSNSAP